MKTQFQKRILSITMSVLALTVFTSFHTAAQTVHYITLTIPSSGPVGGLWPSCPVQTNQLVSVVGLGTANNLPTYRYYFQDGTQITSSYLGNSFIGLTNIDLEGNASSAATFQITTPAAANVISNYVPADSVVIPASTTGNVQIILESSLDLVNWTAAQPGIYGPSAATNRFFRVRAVVN